MLWRNPVNWILYLLSLLYVDIFMIYCLKKRYNIMRWRKNPDYTINCWMNLYNEVFSYWYAQNTYVGNTTSDLLQIKTFTFSTHALILFHPLFLSQRSQIIIYKFSHWNSLQGNAPTKLNLNYTSLWVILLRVPQPGTTTSSAN